MVLSSGNVLEGQAAPAVHRWSYPPGPCGSPPAGLGVGRTVTLRQGGGHQSGGVGLKGEGWEHPSTSWASGPSRSRAVSEDAASARGTGAARPPSPRRPRPGTAQHPGRTRTLWLHRCPRLHRGWRFVPRPRRPTPARGTGPRHLLEQLGQLVGEHVPGSNALPQVSRTNGVSTRSSSRSAHRVPCSVSAPSASANVPTRDSRAPTGGPPHRSAAARAPPVLRAWHPRPRPCRAAGPGPAHGRAQPSTHTPQRRACHPLPHQLTGQQTDCVTSNMATFLPSTVPDQAETT